MTTNDEQTLSHIKQFFSAYLQKAGHRKTRERFAILEEVYSRDDHFDADTLYMGMKSKNFRVSRATVYNTLDLLVNCNLVTKHLFNSGNAVYERAFGFYQHDHLVCKECGKITEFCDPRIHNINRKVAELMHFQVTEHKLTLYGLCANCVNKNTPHEAEY